MFTLHETTQRRVCRVTFLVLCVVPTLLTLIGVAYCNRPWRQADWQQTLAQSLHLRAVLVDVTRPLPGVTELKNLQLADLRTNLPLGSIDLLSFRRQNSRRTLHADHLVIESEQFPAFATAIATWLATGEREPVDFRADRLTLNGPLLRMVQLKNLSITSLAIESPGQRFQLHALDEAGEALQLVLENNNGTLHCLVDTRQVPLPAWLLGKLVPGISGCDEATFQGTVSITSESQHLQGKLQGQFRNVDLHTWLGTASPHRLQGVAQLHLEQLTWSGNRIETARGSLEAGRGASSFSLLRNAHELCRCVTGPTWSTLKPATKESLVPFDQLALSFQMNRSGITVAGQCAPTALMVRGEIPLLLAPPQGTVLPVGLLVVLLDYRHQPGWLPATSRAHDMAGKLPLPESSTR